VNTQYHENGIIAIHFKLYTSKKVGIYYQKCTFYGMIMYIQLGDIHFFIVINAQ